MSKENNCVLHKSGNCKEFNCLNNTWNDNELEISVKISVLLLEQNTAIILNINANHYLKK